MRPYPFTLFLTCFLLFQTVQSNAQKIVVFPSIQSVVEHFTNTYGFNQFDAWQYGFEKHLDGYYLTEFSAESYPAIASREMIWSAKTQNWAPMKRGKMVDGLGRAVDIRADTFYFNRLPCYGYANWYLDVISAVENSSSKDANTLFALAYSWEHRTQGMLGNERFFNEKSKELIKLAPARPAMNPEQLELFLQYKNTAAGYFKQLAEQYPEYQTIIGPSPIKYADHLMHCFLELQMFQGEDVAMDYFRQLPPVPYNDFLLESARNFLNSCPPNAVFISYGDNDTYPLLYVQAKEHYRTDVRVVNLSLLVLGHYINNLKTPSFDSKPLRLSLSDTYYMHDSTLQILTLQDDADSLVNAFDFLQELGSGQGPSRDGYAVLPSLDLFWQVNKTGHPTSTLNDKNPNVQLHIGDDYWLRSQTAILDLILHNTPDRPICFGVTNRSTDIAMYEKYLRVEGLVYRFEPISDSNLNRNFSGSLDPTINYSMLKTRFQVDKNAVVTADGIPAYQLYGVLAISTAQELLSAGDTLKSKMLTDWYVENLSNKRRPWGQFAYYIADLYKRAGYPAKAAEVLDVFISDCESGRYDEYDMAYFKNGIFDNIKTMAEDLNDKKLIQRIDRL